MTEELMAAAATALLRSSGVRHHRPLNDVYLSGVDDPASASFHCDWCGREISMLEMLTGGGKSTWSDDKSHLGINPDCDGGAP